MSSSPNAIASAKTSKKSTKASRKKGPSTREQNVEQPIDSESDCDLYPDQLAALLDKAKDSAADRPPKLASGHFKTKAFKGGKFIDPIGESVKRQLYIKDIVDKTGSTLEVKPAKLNFSNIAIEDSKNLSGSAATESSYLKEPQTNVEQALALCRTNGIAELKIKYDLDSKLSKSEATKLKESNAGSKWFNMPAPVMTPELKRDLELLSLRNVLDRKKFYKKADKQPVSKFLQVGTIIEDKSEFYSARISKKDRKSNMVQELLHDSESQNYFTSRFYQLQQNAAQNCRKPSTKRFKNSYSKR